MASSKQYLLSGLVSGLLLCALAFVGCGGDSGDSGGGGGKAGPAGGSAAAPKAVTVSDSLAALVPTNAAALVYVKSPADLESKVRGFVARFDAEAADDIQLAPMVGSMLKGAEGHWDPTKPMAIAIALPAEGQDLEAAMEGPAMIFGMKDAAAAKTAMEAANAKRMQDIPEKYRPKPDEMPRIIVAGNYLTIEAGPAVQRGGSTIAATAPEGDIGLRIDLAAIVSRYREDIDEGLAEMQKGVEEGIPGLPPSAASLGDMFKGLASGVTDLVNSAETLDLSISIDGGSVDLAVGFVAKQGSKLDKPNHDHSGLAALAAHLPEGMPVNALLSFDMGSMMQWLKPLMEAGMESMPEDARANFKTYIDETTEMTQLLGKNWAMSMSLGDQGIEGVQVGDCKDAATYLARVDKLFEGDVLKGMPGINGKKTGATKIAGVDVHGYEIGFDFAELMKMQDKDAELPPEASEKMSGMMKALFGGNAMKMQMANVDGKLLYSFGQKDHMTALIDSVRKGGGQAPAALASAMDRTGGKPTFLLHLEVRTLARKVVALISEMMDEKMPAVPAGAAIPVIIWGKHDGRVYGGGLQVDVGGIVEMVKAMDK